MRACNEFLYAPDGFIPSASATLVLPKRGRAFNGRLELNEQAPRKLTRPALALLIVRITNWGLAKLQEKNTGGPHRN